MRKRLSERCYLPIIAQKMNERFQIFISPAGYALRPVQRVGGRSPAARLSSGLRGGPPARLRLGDAQHQQSQRANLEEVMPRRPRLLEPLHPRLGRAGSPATGHLRQSAEKAAR